MNTRAVLSLGLSSLVLGGTMVGCSGQGMSLASAGSSAVGSHAASEADAARAALGRHKTDQAIDHAERAVAQAPQNATYRALLGESYLAAGRFDSARQAFADAVVLAPTDPRMALSLALSQTATGDWVGARATLAAHTTIPAADRGLATALAGDPAGAIQILLPAARAPGADAKTRQNLALAFALAGHWQEARALAALDVAPDKLDRRMSEWAAFASPRTKADQVASLLGVRAASDPGFPAALALAAPASVVAPVQVAEASAPAAAAPVAVTAAAPAEAKPGITFAAAHEVVQPLPVEVVPAAVAVEAAPRASVAPARAVAAFQPAAGSFYVQLGAYDTPGVAHDGWVRASRRFAALRGHTPHGVRFTRGDATFYRLSVGGFARADADRLCHGIRHGGGTCFVRAGAGDAMAQWVKPGGVKLASR